MRSYSPPTWDAGDMIQCCINSTFSKELKLELWTTGAITYLHLELWNGEGYAVSDGSFRNGSWAAAWIIEGTNQANQLTGSCFTPGTAADHSTFRSKLAGLLGLLYTLSFWWPPSGKPPCHIACDGQSAIHQLNSTIPIEPTEPHSNLLLAVWQLLQNWGFQIQLEFVCGHQDTGTPMVLTWDAPLNIEADNLAKRKVNLNFSGPIVYKLPGNSWACYTSQGQRPNNLMPSSGYISMAHPHKPTGCPKLSCLWTPSCQSTGNFLQEQCVRCHLPNIDGCPRWCPGTLPMERIWSAGINALPVIVHYVPIHSKIKTILSNVRLWWWWKNGLQQWTHWSSGWKTQAPTIYWSKLWFNTYMLGTQRPILLTLQSHP